MYIFSECRVSLHGEEYRGHTNTTENGEKCLEWYQAQTIYTRENLPTNENAAVYDNNFCRNPKASKDRPWCYVQRNETIQWAFCDVPICGMILITILITKDYGMVLYYKVGF